MSTVRPDTPAAANVAIEDVTGIKERTIWQHTIASQAFWVTVTVILICIATAIEQPNFATKANFFNITRNFAAIGIMAMGMTAVILTGGIDLSVGSVMALSAIGAARMLEMDFPWYMAVGAGLSLGLLAGAINGWLIAYVKLPPFVVTLGMLSIARSMAVVLSENRVIYQFGTGGEFFKSIGGGRVPIPWIDGGTLDLSNMFVILVIATILTAFILHFTAWGRYLFAIGGNEDATRMTGVPVDRIKFQAYLIAGLTAAIAAVMMTGWQGSASNGMGKGFELYVIAATVIGGANLMGGHGSAYGAFIGAALIFLIRNSLIMFGVDANWYDLFVGLFIIFAVLIERIRGKRGG
ncbi:MAG: ABC transporter permease [Alphaproteobacteria bacterium]|nr:ABC transporter permease [Alphaproteobacteria bacterium]